MTPTSTKLELERVRWGVPIPLKVGIDGVNERCIEVPLGLEVARLSDPGWVLDAGCALLPALNTAFPQYRPRANVVHVTQNIEHEVCVPRGTHASFVSADLRDLRLFATGAFSRAVCISTLEHIGGDNAQYGASVERDPDSVWIGVEELRRVVSGDLLLTVPVHPTGYDCGRWRYFTCKDVDRIGGEVRYYASNQSGQWYGGTAHPLPFTSAPSSKPQQIACIRV